MIKEFNLPIGRNIILEDDFILTELDDVSGDELLKYIPGVVRVGIDSWQIPKGLVLTIKSIKFRGKNQGIKVGCPKSKQRDIQIDGAYLEWMLGPASLNGLKYSEI